MIFGGKGDRGKFGATKPLPLEQVFNYKNITS